MHCFFDICCFSIYLQQVVTLANSLYILLIQVTYHLIFLKNKPWYFGKVLEIFILFYLIIYLFIDLFIYFLLLKQIRISWPPELIYFVNFFWITGLKKQLICTVQKNSKQGNSKSLILLVRFFITILFFFSKFQKEDLEIEIYYFQIESAISRSNLLSGDQNLLSWDQIYHLEIKIY